MAAALPDGDEKQHDRGDDRYQDDGVVGIAFHGQVAPVSNGPAKLQAAGVKHRPQWFVP
jgi:hypothetical protein